MKIDRGFFWHVEHGTKKTVDIEIAKAVALKTGKPPAIYLSDKIKSLALRLYPELKKSNKGKAA